MINPQTLHDTWLVVTVITTLEISGIAIYLLAMFSSSSRRRFFWAIAAVLIAVSFEQCTAEIKNLYGPAPPDAGVGLLWLGGRVTEAIVAGGALAYLVFGRNGDSKKT